MPCFILVEFQSALVASFLGKREFFYFCNACVVQSAHQKQVSSAWLFGIPHRDDGIVVPFAVLSLFAGNLCNAVALEPEVASEIGLEGVPDLFGLAFEIILLYGTVHIQVVQRCRNRKQFPVAVKNCSPLGADYPLFAFRDEVFEILAVGFPE